MLPRIENKMAFLRLKEGKIISFSLVSSERQYIREHLKIQIKENETYCMTNC